MVSFYGPVLSRSISGSHLYVDTEGNSKVYYFFIQKLPTIVTQEASSGMARSSTISYDPSTNDALYDSGWILVPYKFPFHHFAKQMYIP